MNVQDFGHALPSIYAAVTSVIVNIVNPGMGCGNHKLSRHTSTILDQVVTRLKIKHHGKYQATSSRSSV